MERLAMMKESLMNCVQEQMSDLKNTNAKELGEAIDMIKDLAEASYYCAITKAMEENDKNKDAMKYTYPPVIYNGGRSYYHDDWNYPRYYDKSSSSEYPMEIRDYREGRSPMTRRMYMESKELHHGKEKQMKELEKYMGELSQDIMEMISDATPDEKAMLSQKLNTLASKID